jgi:HAMP domain-containing protein
MRKKPTKSSAAGNGAHGNGNGNGNGNSSHDLDVLPLRKAAKPKKGAMIHPQLDQQPSNLHFSGILDHRELLRVLTEVKNGNFSSRMPFDQIGLSGKICDTLNEIITMNETMMVEFTRAGQIIGKQGKLNQRIEVPASKGGWSTGVDSLNVLISDLVHPTIQIANVISSVAKGNLSQQMSLEIGGHTLQGEFAQIAKEVNDMVKQLNLFSMEVTRVAREVGSEGKLGGQAKVKGVAGVWKDLTDSVNTMGSNLTAQVRNIAEVTTAVAKGDL